MTLPLSVTTELTTINCGKCGGTYAINECYRQQKQEHSGYWTCPYCKCSWGYGTSEVDRLKKQLEMERKRTEWARTDANQAEARRRAALGQLTKIKNRVGRGVCPCCNRTFQDLQRHMKTKHPELVGEKAA